MKKSLGSASSTEDVWPPPWEPLGAGDHLRRQSQQDHTQEMGGRWSKQGCSGGKSKDLRQEATPEPTKASLCLAFQGILTELRAAESGLEGPISYWDRS